MYSKLTFSMFGLLVLSLPTGVVLATEAEGLNTTTALSRGRLATYEIELTNMMPTQWLSPCLCALHRPGLSLFETGRAATTGQATFAEDGFNGVWADELRQNNGVYSVLECKAGLTPPGATRIERISGPVRAKLTCAAMPVTTNDVLTVHQQVRPPRRLRHPRSFDSTPWDLGSEQNNYAAASMPLDVNNLVPLGPDNPVTLADSLVFGPGGQPTGSPAVLSFFARAFAGPQGVTAEGTMYVFESYEGSIEFPAETYGWSGSASRLRVTRIDGMEAIHSTSVAP